ncbi:MAG: COX15/CtaA family protein [Saprospiraceae bacterium]
MSKSIGVATSSAYVGIHKWVKFWLCVGLFMVVMQVVIGGITRLTGSGLSITKWEIVIGTLPPTSGAAWEEAFDLYKETPQYKKINDGMSMSEFKFIYFWEYFHRLWARSMGFVFALPFFFFLKRGWLPKPLVRRLGIVILLAGIVASFGWIMVASGLVERPWVNAYKLTGHLSLAFLLYSYLLWTVFKVFKPKVRVTNNSMLKNWSIGITAVVSIQIILGGIMSGIKAGLFYPTWPDMNGEVIPAIVLHAQEWNVDNIVNYDTNTFMPALIQTLHRTTAYILTIMILYFLKIASSQFTNIVFKRSVYLLVIMLIIQFLLGVFTLVSCKGSIPVGLGVLHQAGALALLSFSLFVNYLLTRKLA